MKFLRSIWYRLHQKRIKKSMKISLEAMNKYLLFLQDELVENPNLTLSDIESIRKSRESVEGAISIMILVSNYYGVEFHMEKSNGEMFVDWDEKNTP